MIKYDDNIDGEYYHIKLVDDRTVRKEASLGTKESFELMEAIALHFINHPDPMVVPVYKWEVLGRPQKSNYGIFSYQYDMKRLGMLDENEKNLIYYMNMHKLYGGGYMNSASKVEYLSPQYPELYEFMKEVLALNRYTDCHGGNFLKDEDESYKIIDLEGFIRTPLNRKENDWFTKVK
jgi:hypothetical protein